MTGKTGLIVFDPFSLILPAIFHLSLCGSSLFLTSQNPERFSSNRVFGPFVHLPYRRAMAGLDALRIDLKSWPSQRDSPCPRGAHYQMDIHTPTDADYSDTQKAVMYFSKSSWGFTVWRFPISLFWTRTRLAGAHCGCGTL